MRRDRGFTLIELAIVLGMVAILAGLGLSSLRASRRNAGVAAAAALLQIRLDQLQLVSLAEQREQLLVVADVPSNDASQCGTILSSGCARVFHLRASADPAVVWVLKDFNVNAPGNNVDAIVDYDRLGEGVKFYLGAAGTATLPVPFNAYAASFKTFDPELVANCAGSRKCVAWRFKANGQVVAEPPDPASPPAAAKSGHAIALGSELTGQTGGARQIGVLVASPSGITRAFAVP